MRTIDDAIRLREALESHPYRTALVVGASMVGIKVVELLNNRGIHTTLADMAPRMFPLAAYESVSREIERRITQKGVQLALGSALASVEETGDGFVCSMTDGSTVQADLIVLCIGTRTNVSLVDPAEVTVNKGIVVDHDMQTSVPGIYAAGDCCEGEELQSNTSMIIGLWAMPPIRVPQPAPIWQGARQSLTATSCTTSPTSWIWTSSASAITGSPVR